MTLGVPASLNDILEVKLTEAMTLPLPEAAAARALGAAAWAPIVEFLNEKNEKSTVALGPGIGTHPETRELVARLVRDLACPMVIDADGINNLAGATAGLKDAAGPRILTPHPGEMARLVGLTTPEVQARRLDLARDTAARFGGHPGVKRRPDGGGRPRRPGLAQLHRQPGPGQRRHRGRAHRPHRRFSGPGPGSLGRRPPGRLPPRPGRGFFCQPARATGNDRRGFTGRLAPNAHRIQPGHDTPGRGRYMLYARDIMTTEVLTVSPETSIADLSKTLENRQIGGVPVVDQDGRLVGVITQSDLVERARDLELPPAINILDFHFYLQIPSHSIHKVEKMLGTTVGDCMSPDPVTVAPDTPVAQIAALMAKQQVHTIPVVKAGKIVGVIGKMDLVRAMAQEPGE